MKNNQASELYKIIYQGRKHRIRVDSFYHLYTLFVYAGIRLYNAAKT